MFFTSATRVTLYHFLRRYCKQDLIWKSYSSINIRSPTNKALVSFSGFMLGISTFTLAKDTSKIVPSVTVVKAADLLYNEGKFEELYSTLKEHRNSSDPELLWRLARAIFEKCRTLKNEKEKLLYYEEALQIVDEALDLNEKCWAAHKWRAILLDYVWRYKSSKQRIVHSFDIRKHMERAIELNPSDATTYYLIGEWCFTFADMPWYQRKVASAILASPPTSTYEEALMYFEKAEKVSPLFYSMNLLMIGKCYLKTNNKQKAEFFLRQTKDYPVKTVDDQMAHEEAEKLLECF